MTTLLMPSDPREVEINPHTQSAVMKNHFIELLRTATIGRRVNDTAISKEESDILVNKKYVSVSRAQAILKPEKNGCVLQNIGKNSILVIKKGNQNEIRPKQELLLENGDIFYLASIQIRITSEESSKITSNLFIRPSEKNIRVIDSAFTRLSSQIATVLASEPIPPRIVTRKKYLVFGQEEKVLTQSSSIEDARSIAFTIFQEVGKIFPTLYEKENKMPRFRINYPGIQFGISKAFAEVQKLGKKWKNIKTALAQDIPNELFLTEQGEELLSRLNEFMLTLSEDRSTK